MIEIGSIVEGHGEIESLPILVRRIAAQYYPNIPCKVTRPVRVARDRLGRAGELERSIELVRRQATGRSRILLLLDCDDGCPVTEAMMLRGRALSNSEVPFEVVLAVREFEGWFLASLHSLAGKRGLPSDAQSHTDPESVRGAKEWLSNLMPGTRRYTPTLDQPALTAGLDLASAEKCRSFRRRVRAIGRLLGEE